jgi:DNA-directed RNA polymerase sigma subunit (sigma70/sigma32)
VSAATERHRDHRWITSGAWFLLHWAIAQQSRTIRLPSLVKVSQCMNLSRESIRKLERQALAQLRRQKEDMRDYMAG